jgi:hypothetical protein
MKSILIRALSLFLIFSISAATAVEIREEGVQFKPGETGATINPYLTHTINIYLKTICCVIKNLRVALHFEK